MHGASAWRHAVRVKTWRRAERGHSGCTQGCRFWAHASSMKHSESVTWLSTAPAMPPPHAASDHQDQAVVWRPGISVTNSIDRTCSNVKW